MSFEFREVKTHFGNKIYYAGNEEARDFFDFMNWPCSISEAKMDKAYDWLTNLGHEVLIDDQAECSLFESCGAENGEWALLNY